MLGSAILVSSAVVHVRRKAFERRFKHIIEVERHERRAGRNSDLSQSRPLQHFGTRTGSELQGEDNGVAGDERNYDSPGREGGRIHVADHMIPLFPFQLVQQNIQVGNAGVQRLESIQDIEAEALSTLRNKNEDGAGSLEIPYASSFPRVVPHGSPSASRSHRKPYELSDAASSSSITHLPKTASDLSCQNSQVRSDYETEKSDHGTQRYFKSGGTIGRNSQFHNLTAAEREHLGGVEYRAITLLEILVPLYFCFWQFFGCIGLGAWIALNAADITLQNGLNPWYDLFLLASRDITAL
ncbi:hypothetical protein MMC17_003731 [Xylographa soralifera]|nr:hypothetical protein [Xylographa soralifera]